ncbi:secreted frizzled-related protein 5 [Latimeria chalumnae]
MRVGRFGSSVVRRALSLIMLAVLLQTSLLPWGARALFLDPSSSTRCMPIPQRMALCYDIGYQDMRLPNLLEHETAAEAIHQSSSWLPLLARECHPDARIFLCSLFAPICFDRFIYPCRSLCEAVRSSCAPIMACYGFSWPEILNCNKFPADHGLCISSIARQINTNLRTVPQASCTDCELEEARSYKEILETFCSSDFVVKIRITKRNVTFATISDFVMGPKLDILKHGPLLKGEVRPGLQQWLALDATCVRNIMRGTRAGSYLVTGEVRSGKMVVNKAYLWHRKDKNLMQASRKWKQHRCQS